MDKIRVIQPVSGWRGPNFKEIWAYRDLLYFLVWRDIKVRYAQSVLGIGWALIQPIFYMVVFTVIFGYLVKVKTDGAPYAIFSYVALVPWAYFSNALVATTGSLTQNSNLLTKVYFPRVVMPMASVLSQLIDFAIAMLLVFAMLGWYRIMPTSWIVTLPLLILIMSLSAGGIGIWLTALAVQYRDIKYALTFMVQGMMFASPIVYPVSLIPDRFEIMYAINPMVGVIEGFRSALLGTNPMPWDLIGIGCVSAIAISVSGLMYFHRMEKNFADVV